MHNFTVVSKTAEAIIVDPACGASLSAVAAEAVELACIHNLAVQFDFNGVRCEATKESSADKVAQDYMLAMERNAKEYRESPEHRALQERRAAALVITQVRIDNLLALLPTVTWSEGTLMRWLGEFAFINDDIGLEFSTQAIGAAIQDAGWTVNDCLRHHDVKHARSVFARWVIGQALDNLRIDMPIHQVVNTWVERYENWKPAYRSRNQREGHFIGRVRQFKDGKRTRIRRRQGIGSFKNWMPLNEMPKAHKRFVELYLKQEQ